MSQERRAKVVDLAAYRARRAATALPLFEAPTAAAAPLPWARPVVTPRGAAHRERMLRHLSQSGR
jgi:hypothetical protein